jgi:AcrR family transcriptional regulator
MSKAAAASAMPPAPGRRALRRQQTIDEILDIAEELVAANGANGLSLSEVARRLGVQPPSLYKYFPSLLAIYDALFRRGQEEHLAVMASAMAAAEPGLEALTVGLEASGRWLLAHPATAQLLFWRPVPSFQPSPGAMAPSVAMVELQRKALADAVAAGQIGAPPATDDPVYVVSTLITGVLSQAMANEPELPWGAGRFTPQFRRLMGLLPTLYPPPVAPTDRRERTGGVRPAG